MTAQALDDAQGRPGEQRAWYTSVALACLAHVISLAAIQTLQHAAPARTLTTSVQLLAPRPAPAPPPAAADEPPPPEPPKAAPKARSKPASPSAQPTPPPAAAPAPALLTAQPTPGEAAPVRFASDPHGQSYASGRVALGGVAAVSSNEPVAARARPQEEQVTPADQLQRQPLWNGGDCQGYFPEHAQVDQGRVSLIAVVRGDGSIARLDVSNETPPQSGFARAARACIMQRSFSPALGRDGRPTTARTQINLRFSR